MRKVMPAAVLTAALLVFAFPGTAVAHEERDVGDLTMAVGFGAEPAYAGQPNSAQLILSRLGKPVTNLGDALEVEVTFGSESTKLSLEPDFEIGEFGTPGDYRAWFVPTQAGTYTFHFTGTVSGQKVDETFTSGKGFDDVMPISDAEFPVTQAPTTAELSQRLDREVPRLQQAIGQVRTTANETDPLVIVALVVGVLGIAIGAAGLVMARRKAAGS
ncbi:MAG TPA: hypothetical protein VH989_08180 [Actinomycetota bacterium]|jgi:hypothetical protein